MLRRKRIDPLARQSATAIAAGRMALGLSALLAPGPALKALGFSEIDGTSVTLTRLLGTRDVAVALLTLAVRDDPGRLRTATAVSAAVDAADALVFGLPWREPGEWGAFPGQSADKAPRARTIGVLSGGSAALAGLWAWRRLG
jgi:hypothetical protein